MKPGRAVEMTGYGKRGKPNPGFPPFPQPLEIAARFPHSHSPDDESLYQKTTQEKEALRRIASLPPSGSFFNEKMLRVRAFYRSHARRSHPSNSLTVRSC